LQHDKQKFPVFSSHGQHNHSPTADNGFLIYTVTISNTQIT